MTTTTEEFESSFQATLSSEWDVLLSYLPLDLDLNESAKEWKAIQRPRGIRTGEDLFRIALIYGGCDYSLRNTAAWAEVMNIASVSDVAVMDRLTNASEWMGFILGKILSSNAQVREIPAELQELQIRLVDGSSLSLPGSTGTDWRIHTSMNLNRMCIDQVFLHDVKTGESFTQYTYQPGDLILGDAGFSHRRGIASIVNAGADCLVRLHLKAVPLETHHGEPFDILKALRTLKPGEVGDFEVQTQPLKKGKAFYPAMKGRLIAIPKTEVAAVEARRKLRKRSKKKGNTPSKEALESIGYIFLFTTVLQEVASASALLELYRFRWQIECNFKRMKSILSLDQIRAHRPKLVQTYLYTKLISVCLLEKLQERWLSFSPWGDSLSLANHNSVMG